MSSPSGLPDRDARERILLDLDANLLVEAGAGSGKTRSLVDRLVALVATGTVSVDEIAAVTFTRKAASELRERFQEALEGARRDALEGTPERERLEQALPSVDRAFMGTIHAFCARLLREQPLEAGIDPGFTETTASQAIALAEEFWSLHLERLSAEGHPDLLALASVGLRPTELRSLYLRLGDSPDVDFQTGAFPPPTDPEIDTARADLSALLDEGLHLLPPIEHEDGWDPLQRRLRSLRYFRTNGNWNDAASFLNALASFCGVSHAVTQKRWSDTKEGKATVKEFGEQCNAFTSQGPAARAARAWQAHRYPLAIRFASDAAAALASYRQARGQLDFQDLLVLAARVLRENAGARLALGKRFPRILVDEFQDTDPLQAEILFLLASDPVDRGGGNAEATADWQTAQPRPGALFVVGDPKQSIYRFRRADIQLYGQVRSRFERFGSVVRLEANFRSSVRVSELVNQVFSGPQGFPAEAEPAQAAFAPLLPQRVERPEAEGVYYYRVEHHKAAEDMAAWDAEALADWIAGRIERGERTPGDFLVLTRTKAYLARYAQAMEARDLPVQVSGADSGLEEEMRELRMVLDALSDPGNPILTASVLIGLFFGLDLEQLLEHRLSGGSFDFRFASAGRGPVEEALNVLSGWWKRLRSEPADVAVARIADEIGLLPHAAAGDLGALRAGVLSFALDALRGAGVGGDTSLTGALEAMDLALREDDADSPLEPGRSDVIRVMNVHKAKGLEGNVVVLARPIRPRPRDPEYFIERGPGGTRGWMPVTEPTGEWGMRVLARPMEWDEKETMARAFEAAEELRILYVAATRARDELVVAVPSRDEANVNWSPLHAGLFQLATELSLSPSAPPPRQHLEISLEALRDEESAALDRRERAALESHRFVSVTSLTKGAEGQAVTGSGSEAAPDPTPFSGPDPASGGPGGYAWGSVVHAVLEAAARGAEGDRLRAVGRSLLLDLDRPSRAGEPLETAVLMETVQAVLSSDIWRRALAAPRRMAEVPFALRVEGSEPPVFLEGVLDLVFREADGWVVVDYKTDRGDDPDFPARRLRYREQLRLYGEAWEQLVGEPVKERMILYVRGGGVESVEA